MEVTCGDGAPHGPSFLKGKRVFPPFSPWSNLKIKQEGEIVPVWKLEACAKSGARVFAWLGFWGPSGGPFRVFAV